MLADFLGISDVLWQVFLTAFVTLFLAYMQDRTRRTLHRATEAAAAKLAAKVKADLATAADATAGKLEALQETGTATHKIVNQQRTDMMAKIDALEQALRDLKAGRGE